MIYYLDWLLGDNMAVKCPVCTVVFYPMLKIMLLGSNNAENGMYLFYQNCPGCNELLIGVKKVAKWSRVPTYNETTQVQIDCLFPPSKG
jgi:hypothetical protein